jgi:oxygen-independent coproporphyrinogen-3 oxidase
VRVARPRGQSAYEAWVAALAAAGHGMPAPDPAAGPPPAPAPADAAMDLLTDIVMLRLRTADGLDVGEVGARFGAAAAAAVDRALAAAADAGRAVVRDAAAGSPGRVWRLTDPVGFVVSNAVIADVFAALDGVGAVDVGGW